MEKKKEKFTAEYCPKCKDKKMVRLNDQIEIFECENCKFRKVKK